jgi:hypothetical protein
MFKKQYKKYVQENKGIVREYQEQGLLVKINTDKKKKES